MFQSHQTGMVKQVEIPSDWPDWKVEIAEALNAKGLSMKVVSLRSGLNETFVRDLLKREKKPMHDNLERVREVLGLAVPTEKPVAELNVLGVIQAGTYRDVTLALDKKILPAVPVAASPRYPHAKQYALYVDGDSMDKLIEDGSYVTCVDFAGSGVQLVPCMVLHVERHNGALVETTLKRYAEISGKRWLLPESSNSTHQPIEVNGGEETEICVRGLVIGSWKPISF